MELFDIVDAKLEGFITQKAVEPAVILVNSSLYRQYQMGLLDKDLSQPSGFVRSPYNLRNYKGIQVIPSQVVSDVEIF